MELGGWRRTVIRGAVIFRGSEELTHVDMQMVSDLQQFPRRERGAALAPVPHEEARGVEHFPGEFGHGDTLHRELGADGSSDALILGRCHVTAQYLPWRQDASVSFDIA